MEEYEEDIIQYYTGENETDAHLQICTIVAKLCKREIDPSATSRDQPNEEL